MKRDFGMGGRFEPKKERERERERSVSEGWFLGGGCHFWEEESVRVSKMTFGLLFWGSVHV